MLQNAPFSFWQRWAFLLEEVKVALPKPERLLPNFIETDRGVEPGKLEIENYWGADFENGKYGVNLSELVGG